MDDKPVLDGDGGGVPADRAGPTRGALWWVGALLATVVVAAVGAFGLGLASAEAKSPSPSPSPGASADGGHGWAGPWWPGPWAGRGEGTGGLFDPGRALHGEVVAAKDGGGTETLLVQRGDAVAVSGSSITVKSTDGFTKQYTLDNETKVNGGRDVIASVTAGDTLVVCAVAGDGRATARSVIRLANK